MPIHSICTAFVSQGQLEESIRALARDEENFTAAIGVVHRRFYQCTTQPHVIWAFTEWESERHHNDAARAVMKTRADDRIASILFGPEPYFEIFCDDDAASRIGERTDDWGCVVVAHGLLATKARERCLQLRAERLPKVADRIGLLRIYTNRYNADEFVAVMGFRDPQAFEAARDIGELRLEEYLLTGLRNPMGMSYLAHYNQFVCKPLPLAHPPR